MSADKLLYTKLKKAYSDKNLNQITGKIIDLYKDKRLGQIRVLTNKISPFVLIDEEDDARCFSKLIMLYHPDKGEYYRNSIEQLYTSGQFDKMEEYSHILLLEDFDISPSFLIDEDIEYNPEYSWDNSQNGYRYFSDSVEDYSEEYGTDTEYDRTFYNAVKLRMYGNLKQEFPSYYLEDMDDVEFAECGIELLDGIENCKHVVTLNLSGNHITDLSGIWYLNQLEELYVAHNQIGYIDVLSNLTNLRVVDMSGNEIRDISPLFELENLEYVNLIGNKIPINQIEELKKKYIMVIH